MPNVDDIGRDGDRPAIGGDRRRLAHDGQVRGREPDRTVVEYPPLLESFEGGQGRPASRPTFPARTLSFKRQHLDTSPRSGSPTTALCPRDPSPSSFLASHDLPFCAATDPADLKVQAG